MCTVGTPPPPSLGDRGRGSSEEEEEEGEVEEEVVVVDDVEIDGQKADKQAAANMEQHQHSSWLAVNQLQMQQPHLSI